MFIWLEALSLPERILLYIAVPATLVLLIQTLLLLVGAGGGHDAAADGDASWDLDGDGIPDDLSLEMDVDGSAVDLDGDGVPDAPAGDGDAADGGGEVHTGLFSGLNVFTIRGFVTFFTLFGWSGLLFFELGLHPIPALFLAVQVGVIGMVGVALILRAALGLQFDGTLEIRRALGQPGSVYLTVPAGRTGRGKVNVVVQEQLQEFEAVTDAERPIPTGADIIVTGVLNGDTLVVAEVISDK